MAAVTLARLAGQRLYRTPQWWRWILDPLMGEITPLLTDSERYAFRLLGAYRFHDEFKEGMMNSI
jgi:hypothetical protein